MQTLAIGGCGWDELIPEAHSRYWRRFVQALSALESFDVPRCYFPKGFNPVNVQL